MDDDQRDAIRRSNQMRNLRCRKCGAVALRERDGAEIGGMPGLKYEECGACGNARAITKRPKREKLNT